MPGVTLALLDGLCIPDQGKMDLKLALQSGHVCEAWWCCSLLCSVHLWLITKVMCTLAAGAVLLPLP